MAKPLVVLLAEANPLTTTELVGVVRTFMLAASYVGWVMDLLKLPPLALLPKMQRNVIQQIPRTLKNPTTSPHTPTGNTLIALVVAGHGSPLSESHNRSYGDVAKSQRSCIARGLILGCHLLLFLAVASHAPWRPASLPRDSIGLQT